MNKLMRTVRKFNSLSGFVAAIFTLLAIRAICVAFIHPGFWPIISAILVSIFAYWWLKRVLGIRSSVGRSTCNHNRCGSRDLDL